MKRLIEMLAFFTSKGDKGCGDFWKHDWNTSVELTHPSDANNIMPYYECKNEGCREAATVEFYNKESLLRDAEALIQ